ALVSAQSAPPSLGACAGQTDDRSVTNETIQPVPCVVAANAPMGEMGKQLFFDPRLSKSGFISCNSCHNLSMGGSDNLPTSIGHNWQKGPINAPTALNARTH